MRITSLFVASLACGCVDALELSQSHQALMDFGANPLQLTWMKTSHNTYQEGHTPTDQSIAWHLQNDVTYQLELDLRDTMYFGSAATDWIVAHSFLEAPTPYCVGGYTFSFCLNTLYQWHTAHPGHALITVWLDKKEAWQSTDCGKRSPCRLDGLISTYFSDAELVLPRDLSTSNLRSAVEGSGWQAHSNLANKFMFILTSDATTTGNGRLHSYVTWHMSNARAFVAPFANTSSAVTAGPSGFNANTIPWVAIYNFEWTDLDDDGECDSLTCTQVPAAHDRNYLTRVWDVDDWLESDTASNRPFGGSYGHANFIAIDTPWQSFVPGGYGYRPDGVYPW